MKYIVKLELKNPVIKSNTEIIISFFKSQYHRIWMGYFYEELYKAVLRRSLFVWSFAFHKPVFWAKMELEGNEVNMTLKFEEQQTALIYYSSL